MKKLIAQGSIFLALSSTMFGVALALSQQSAKAQSWTHGASGGGSYCNSSHCLKW